MLDHAWEAVALSHDKTNRLIHGYDAVDFDILWQIISVDLPRLITSLEKIIAAFPSEENAAGDSL